MTQQPLFTEDPNETKAISSLVFSERIRRIERDGVVYFSILDVFQHYGKAKNATTSWRTVNKRLERQGFDLTREILDSVLDGGRRPTPMATFQVMLRIAQATDFKEWENLRRWMAEVAHERLEEIVNPERGVERADNQLRMSYLKQGKDEQWIEARLEGIKHRKQFIGVAKQTHVTHAPDYARLTDAEYKVAFGAIQNDLVKQMGLSKSQANKFRDHIGTLATQLLSMIETSAVLTFRRRAKEFGRALYDHEQEEIVIQLARPLSKGAIAAAEISGIDLLTGQSTLASNV